MPELDIDWSDDRKLAAIGRVLRKARCRREWSQLTLATRAGVHRSLVHRYESGRPRSLPVLLRLCRALRINLEQALVEDAQEPGRERW